MTDPKLIEAMATGLEQCEEDALGLHNLSPQAQERFLWRARAALSAAEEAGWQLCPKEPTGAMVYAGMEESLAIMAEYGVDRLSPFKDYPSPTEITKRAYRAMLAASERSNG